MGFSNFDNLLWPVFWNFSNKHQENHYNSSYNTEHNGGSSSFFIHDDVIVKVICALLQRLLLDLGVYQNHGANESFQFVFPNNHYPWLLILHPLLVFIFALLNFLNIDHIYKEECRTTI